MNNLFLTLYVKLQNLMNREEGQDLVEYALLVCLVALAAITGVNKVAACDHHRVHQHQQLVGVTPGRITHPRHLSPFAGGIRGRLSAGAYPSVRRSTALQKKAAGSTNGLVSLDVFHSCS